MKIAVLRANYLGDFIFVLPALQALRETFPLAEIVYLGKSWHKDFLSNRPGPINRVVIIPPYPGVGEDEKFEADEGQLIEFFNQMQEEKFDLAFQLHGGGRYSNPFLLNLGAKQTIGLKTPDALALDLYIPYVYYFSEVLRYLEVVSLVGAKTKDIEPTVSVTETDLLEAGKILNNPENKRLVVIHPGARDIRRRWPAEKFAIIADFLIEQGFSVCINGIASEKDIITAVLSNMLYRERVQNLCDELSLSALTGVLSLANLFISNDTGPLHLAKAVQTPTVGIYWGSNSITGLHMTTARNQMLISFALNCSICGEDITKLNSDNIDIATCNHATSFVTDISPDQVKEAVQELLVLNLKKA